MVINLVEWRKNNDPSKEMLWRDALYDQLNFMRTRIAGLLARNKEEFASIVQVDGSHTSKSIICPVYYIDLHESGVKIWMRYNFYNWNITVRSSSIPITCDFLGIVGPYDYCFCEGMEDKKCGPYEKDNKNFTVCLSDHYECYVFFRVLRKHLGISLSD